MAKHVFLLDITRHGSPVQTMVGSARALLSPFNPVVVEWISVPEQTVQSLPGEDVRIVQNPYDARDYIGNRINTLSNSEAYTFHVFSYDPAVLNRAALLNTPDRAVCPVHLATLGQQPKEEQQTPTRSEPASGVHTGAIKLSEAVELAKRVLSKHGHVSKETALKQTRLRKLMSDEDSRAEKRWGDPQSVRLISHVVSTGLREGWLGQATNEGKSGTEMLWVQAAKSVPQPVLVPGLPATRPLAVPVAPTHGGNVAATQLTTDKGERRTEQIIECLKDEGIYAAKDIRDYIFKALHTKIENASPALSLAQLKRKTLVAAEEEAKSAGVSFKYWYVATESVFKLMLLAGVLGDENGLPIVLGARPRVIKVAKIAPDFICICELFLLQHVLNTLKDVTERDCTALAHALFKEAPSKTTRDQMLDRVDQLFEKLGDRLLEDDDGALSVEPVRTGSPLSLTGVTG